LEFDSKKRLRFGGTQIKQIVVKRAMMPFIFFTRKRIFKYYTGFSFFLFVWISRLEKNPTRLIRHETIHFHQQVELLFVFHWLLYGMFYCVSRLRGQRHYIGYRYNPFELEAYSNDENEEYLKLRKPFAWFKYIGTFRETLNKDMSPHLPKDKFINY
jgi:hypothetical protein